METNRLVIREWESSDEKTLIEMANKPNIQKWLSDWDHPEDWIGKWIQNVRNHYIIDDPMHNFISWAITLKDTKALIGQINIGGDAFDNKEVEVAYFIDDSYTGQGYATEATREVVRYTFQRYGYQEMNAMVEPHNYASVATVKKVGFMYSKTEEKLLSGLSQPLVFDFYKLRNYLAQA